MSPHENLKTTEVNMSRGFLIVNNYINVKTEEKRGGRVVPQEISICDVYYSAHRILPPQLDSPCQILGLVQFEGPMVAAVAAAAAAVVVVLVVVVVVVVLGTQLLVDPPLIHPVGIYHFAVASRYRK